MRRAAIFLAILTPLLGAGAAARAQSPIDPNFKADVVSRTFSALIGTAVSDTLPSSRLLSALQRYPEADTLPSSRLLSALQAMEDVDSLPSSRLASALQTSPEVDSLPSGREVELYRCLTCVLLTSSQGGRALAVTGTLPDQLATLNAAPPPYDSLTWVPAPAKHADVQAAFECDSVGIVPLEMPFVSSRAPLVGMKEVTLDNCGSAFYRFTFSLPDSFLNPVLVGAANVDDQAVAYLNGTRISALMTAPGCQPAGPGDPCYPLQDAGKDRFDANGRAVLTWPTADEFGTLDSTLFQPGLNELIFAVAGDAAPFEPTGVEFIALVNFESDVPTTGVDRPRDGSAPGLRLAPPRPNPTRDEVVLPFELSGPAHVRLSVFDLQGRLVRRVLDRDLGPGAHVERWDGRSDAGSPVIGGIYFARIDASGVELARPFVVLP